MLMEEWFKMSDAKRNMIHITYVIIMLLLTWFNSTLVIEWLNKSLFVDYTLNTEGVNASFYHGASLIFLITILIYSMLGSFVVSLLITDLLFGTFIFANNMKMIERNEFITFTELQTASSPTELFTLVDMPVVSASITMMLVIIGLILIQWAARWMIKKADLLIHRYVRIAFFILTLSSLILIYAYPNAYNKTILNYEVSDGHNFNPVTRARKDGFLPSFIHTIRPMYMEKPLQYNKLNVEDIFEKYTALAKDMNQDRDKPLSESQTILYLSESLIDPVELPDVLLNETPIPLVSELRAEHAGGTMYSQFIGGGTANIEWAVLTSFSLESFLDPVSITPFSDFYVDSKNHHTVLSFYDNQKVAIHPYSAHLYKRKSVYNAIGFDDFLYLDHGIKHTDKLGTHTRVSDEALNKDIFRYLGKDDVGLIHVLTMQNHSPYNGEIPDMPYQPEINPDIFSEDKEERLFNYLQGLKASDEALADLIEKIDDQNREMNLLFYGDHFPSIFRGMEEQFPGDQLHETPWFIYMNQGRSEDGVQIEGLSPSFLIPVLLKEGDYYVTPFYALMDQLLSEGVKRIGHDFVITEDGKISDDNLPDDLLDLVNDYRVILYDALFGSHWLSDDFYTLDH